MLVLQSRMTRPGCLCVSSRWFFILPSDPFWIHFIAEVSECRLVCFPALGLSRQRGRKFCGSQPPRWPPMTLASWISCTCVVPFYSEWDWQGEWYSMNLEARWQKTLKVLPCSPWNYSLWREARCHVIRMLKQPYGEALVVRNPSLQPTARITGQSCEGAILEPDSPGPVRPSEDHSPSQTIQLNCP